MCLSTVVEPRPCPNIVNLTELGIEQWNYEINDWKHHIPLRIYHPKMGV